MIHGGLLANAKVVEMMLKGAERASAPFGILDDARRSRIVSLNSWH